MFGQIAVQHAPDVLNVFGVRLFGLDALCDGVDEILHFSSSLDRLDEDEVEFVLNWRGGTQRESAYDAMRRI